MDNGEPVVDNPGANTRFVDYDDEDLDRFIQQQRNHQPLTKTDGHMKLLKTYLLLKTGKEKDINHNPPAELNLHLTPVDILSWCPREEEMVLNIASTHKGHFATKTERRTEEKEFHL
jgi:hypothetical protein